MWWSDWRIFLLALTALAGCGFTPVYGPGSTASTLRDRVQITAPATIDGYALLQALRDRLGNSAAPIYDLSVTLTITEVPAATTPAGSTTRYTLPGSASFILSGQNGTPLVTGTVDSFTSYSATGSTVATSAAQTDARARLAIILAEQIVTRLSVADLTP